MEGSVDYMDIQLRQKIEGIVGEINLVHLLTEQGCASDESTWTSETSENEYDSM